MNKSTVFILLGTNLGDRVANFSKATTAIDNKIGKVHIKSKIYETAAWGITDQPSFLNQVLVLDTTLNPKEVLEIALKIEKEMGRKRIIKWGERLIDIDILYFENKIIENKILKIPHPFIAERRFTLVPLVEVAKDFMHPVVQKTNLQLLNECQDMSEVILMNY